MKYLTLLFALFALTGCKFTAEVKSEPAQPEVVEPAQPEVQPTEPEKEPEAQPKDEKKDRDRGFGIDIERDGRRRDLNIEIGREKN